MTRSKWLASLAAGLLVVGALALFFPPRREPAVRDVVPPPPAAPVASSDFKSAVPLKRVMDLYATESRRVGRVDPDPAATQRRLEVAARELSAEEIHWLAAQARDARNDADARFFSAYLLGLSHAEASVNALSDLAVLPMPVSKNGRFLEQERAFRASAVEGISHNCKEFPVAVKDALLNVVASQSDDFVRDRAHRGLYACQTGKAIEDQDKEALRKLQK